MLDTAIWKELGVEEVAESEAFYHALATLLSRWLLARSEYPEMGSGANFKKGRRADPGALGERVVTRLPNRA
jgi:hypothetical protein